MPAFENVMATVGRMGFPDFRCVHVGRELSFAWFVSFCVFFQSQTFQHW